MKRTTIKAIGEKLKLDSALFLVGTMKNTARYEENCSKTSRPL